MAKSDTFLIRGFVEHGTAAGYAENTIDLGAFVDTLGKSVLRIRSIQVAHQQQAEPEKGPVSSTDGKTLNYGYQLTTQTQTDMVQLSDKSVIASGQTVTPKVSGSSIIYGIFETNNLNPSMHQDGILIATEQLFVGVQTDVAMSEATQTNVLLECNVEKLDERSAMALALSQS